jgi:hypothetical protein
MSKLFWILVSLLVITTPMYSQTYINVETLEQTFQYFGVSFFPAIFPDSRTIVFGTDRLYSNEYQIAYDIQLLLEAYAFYLKQSKAYYSNIQRYAFVVQGNIVFEISSKQLADYFARNNTGLQQLLQDYKPSPSQANTFPLFQSKK